MVNILLYTSALTLFSRYSLKKQFTVWFIYLVNRVSHVLGRLVEKTIALRKGLFYSIFLISQRTKNYVALANISILTLSFWTICRVLSTSHMCFL